MRHGIGCGKKRTGDGGRASGGRAFGRAEPDVVVAGTAGHHGRLASGRHHGAVADERLFAGAVAAIFWVLLLGRVLQAACTGMSMPMVFTVILLVFPREKRGTAMGVIGLIIGFAPAVGPSVAGLLVDSVGWRALFAIVTVLSVV